MKLIRVEQLQVGQRVVQGRNIFAVEAITEAFTGVLDIHYQGDNEPPHYGRTAHLFVRKIDYLYVMDGDVLPHQTVYDPSTIPDAPENFDIINVWLAARNQGGGG